MIVTYRSRPDGAAETVARIEALGGSAVAVPLDVGDVASFAPFAERLREELAARWGRSSFDHLVDNAGVGGPRDVRRDHRGALRGVHRVLFKGPFFLTQTLLPLLADDGAIVFTSSNSALHTAVEPAYAAYAT